MKKIDTLFLRDPENPKRVIDEVHPDCEWVLAGEGVATEKFDGSACFVSDYGRFYRRHVLKQGKRAPDGWVHWTFDPEQKSGHGWAPVVPGVSSDQYHAEAFEFSDPDEPGTYELVGPKVQGNPHRLERHALWRHGSNVLGGTMVLTFQGIADYLEGLAAEGIVWHHPDGRMAKIKRRDFGFRWPV